MKRKIFFCVHLIFLGLIGWTSNAQNQLNGSITDAKTGQPIIEANIITADSSASAISDFDGKFTLNSNSTTGTLVVSSVGYANQKLHFDQRHTTFNILLVPDEVALSEVMIHAFNSYTKNKDIPAAVASLDRAKINETDGVSLSPALNSVPGVKMDQSAIGDERISIRGSGVRAPWSIRNIKVYLNNIPLTDADGTTSLHDLNISDIGNIEIIKGPASSIYGSGAMGGVINFSLRKAPYDSNILSTNALIGAHGLRKIGAVYQSSSDQLNTYVSYGYTENDGYRNHNSDINRSITGNFEYTPSDKQTVTLFFQHITEDYLIPGALTKDEVKQNRKQAAASNLKHKAARYQHYNRVGLGNEYRFNKNFSNSTSLFTSFNDLHHPLTYTIIRSSSQSFGGRTIFSYNPFWEKFNTKFSLGSEFSESNSRKNQYETLLGEEGDITTNVDNRNNYYTIFFQGEINLTKKMVLTLGGSYNGLRYNIEDYIDKTQSGVKDFKGQFSPRMALSYDFGKFLSLHASVSNGFAPPTSGEIGLPDGSINKNLNAEKGINYEIDAKGNFLNARLNYDVSFYILKLKNELIEQTVAQNTKVYHNSGKSTHTGVEAAVSYQLIRRSDQFWITGLKPFLAATYAHYRFDEYQILDAQNQVSEDFADHEIPGISPWMIYTGFNLDTQIGVYANTHYYFNDKSALNNANTDYNNAYKLVDFKLGYKTDLGQHFGIDLFAGVSNLFNERYSANTALNAVAYGGGQPAYFEPSPGRSGYVGFNFKYHF